MSRVDNPFDGYSADESQYSDRLAQKRKNKKTLTATEKALEAWEVLTLISLSGKRISFPGISTVNVRGIGLKEDSLDLAGENGASTNTTFLGYTDAEADVLIDVWDAAQFDALFDVIEVFRPRRNAKPTAYHAIHPNLQMYGIQYMYIFNIEAQDYDRDNGYQVKLQLRQWQKTVKVTPGKVTDNQGTGGGGKPGTGGGSGGTGGNPKTPKPNGPQTPQKKALDGLPSKNSSIDYLKKMAALGSNSATQLLGGK